MRLSASLASSQISRSFFLLFNIRNRTRECAAAGAVEGRVLRFVSEIFQPVMRKLLSLSSFSFVGCLLHACSALKCVFVLSVGCQPASLSRSTIWLGLPGLKGFHSIRLKAAPAE